MRTRRKIDRAAAGRVLAKARGRVGGRLVTDPEKLEQARIFYSNSERTTRDVCKAVGIGRRVFFSYLAKW